MILHSYRKSCLIGIVLIAYFILRCFYLDAVPRWDAASYWGALMSAVIATQALTSWTDLPRVVLESYNAFGHPSMGYYSLLVLGQLADFPNQFILNMTNILLAVLSIYCVYKIFRWLLPEERQLPEVLVVTAAYAMEPLFFGCSIFLNTDFPVLVFFTLALSLLLYGFYGWFAVACLFMIFSKETGAIFWAAMVGAVGLYAIWALVRMLGAGQKLQLSQLLPPTKRTTEKPLTTFQILFRMGCLVLPGVALAAFLAARRGTMWSGNAGIQFDSNGMNCFGFNPAVIANRAGEIFILDFHWVAVLVIISALLIAFGRAIERRLLLPEFAVPSPQSSAPRPADSIDAHESAEESSGQYLHEGAVSEEKLSFSRRWGVLPILCSFLAFVIFNLSYITYIIPRYTIQGGFFLLVFTVLALSLAIPSRKKRVAILSLILALFSVQTFVTIDPLSKLAFGSAPFGKHKILQIDSPGEAVGNGFVYNSQFAAVDKLFNLMAKKMPLAEDGVIIAWNTDSWYPWFYMSGVFVDPVTLRRTIDWRGTFHYNVIDINALQPEAAPASAFYVYMPWLSVFSNEMAELAKLRTLYSVSEPNEVWFLGHNLRFYRLVRLPN